MTLAFLLTLSGEGAEIDRVEAELEEETEG